MRIRGTAAAALLILVALAFVIGVRPPITAAVTSAQMEFVRAAIHAGSCAEPEATATVPLNGFAAVDQAAGAASSILSVTEAPVALAALLDSPHALLVTLGGDRNALLACGDLQGDPDTSSISVDVRQQNASGLAGISLLVDGGETTRIAVILDEVRTSRPAAVSPTPGATASPAAETPEATATPPFEPRAPVLPGVTPEAATPEVVQPGGDTYTSEEFGYSVVIAEPWRVVDGPTVEPGTDFIAVSNGEGVIDFIGIANDMTAPECIDTIYNYLPTRAGVSLLTAHIGSDAGINLSTPERAIEVWDLVSRDEQGQTTATTVYAQCRVLRPGEAILVTTHEAPAASYSAQAGLREQLYEQVSVP